MLTLLSAVQRVDPLREDRLIIETFEGWGSMRDAMDACQRAADAGDELAICLTVGVSENGGDPVPVSCDICFKDKLGIKYVTPLVTACISCRVAKKLTRTV